MPDNPLSPLTSMNELEQTLKERGGQHGKFADNAEMTEHLLEACRNGKNYPTLSPVMRTALFFIMHKAARVLCGDPNHVDHWHDIGGYAKLAEDEAITNQFDRAARGYAPCPKCKCEIPVTVPRGKCPECNAQLA